MKRVWNYAMSMWQPVGALIIGMVIVTLLFTFRLSSLTPGASPPEIQSRNSSQSLSIIRSNPINAPYKIAQFTVQKVHSSLFFERLVSGFIAAIGVLVFFMLAKRLIGHYAAIMGTVMFALSSALLHNARLAVPVVSLLALLFLLFSGYQLRFNKHRARAWLLAAVTTGLALYVPGIIYFVLIGVIWQFRAVKRRELPNATVIIASFITLAVLLTPLIYGLFQNSELWREYLLIPAILPNFKDFLLQLLAVPAGILAFAPENPVFRLGRQPVLEAFSAAMVILGIYKLVKRYKLDRLFIFSGIFILGSVLTALSGNYEYSFILVPFVYLVVATGINVLLETWRNVFPNNPLARSLAMVLICVAVVVTSNYHLRRYFIAWPNNDTTKTVFTL